MKERILAPWDWLRILRLLIGLSVIFQALYLRSGMLIAAGIMLSSMALLNIGCGVNGCSTTPTARRQTGKVEDTQFEEIT